MQAYDNNNEIAASTIPPLQVVALQYKSTLDNLLSFVHNQAYTRNMYTHNKTYCAYKPPPTYPTVDE